MAYLTTAEILALTPETIRDIPDALLAGMLKRHARGFKSNQDTARTAMIVAEVRRRGPTRIMNWWYLQQLDPDRCACGGPGHYVVGRTTYCGKCKDKGVATLKSVAQVFREPRWSAIEAEETAYDKRMRDIDQQRARHGVEKKRRK